MGMYDDLLSVNEASYENHPVYKKFIKACKDAGIAMEKADAALRRAYIKSRDKRYQKSATDSLYDDVVL